MIDERSQGDVYTHRARAYSVPPPDAGQPQPRPPAHGDHDAGDCDCQECRDRRTGGKR